MAIHGQFQGWKQEDHQKFVRIFTGNNSNEKSEAIKISKSIFYYSIGEIEKHIAWYKEFLALKSKMDEKLKDWKAQRNSQNFSYLQHDEKTTEKDKNNKNRNSKQENETVKEKIKIWRSQKQDFDQNQRELEKKKADEQKNKERQRWNAKFAESKSNMEAIRSLKEDKKSKVLNKKALLTSSPTKLKELRQKDDKYVQKMLEARKQQKNPVLKLKFDPDLHRKVRDDILCKNGYVTDLTRLTQSRENFLAESNVDLGSQHDIYVEKSIYDVGHL